MQIQNKITKYITLFAGIMIILTVTVVPLGYFFISYQYILGNLEMEVEINARLVTQVINANPEMWEFQKLRIEEYLMRRPEKGDAEIRRVFNNKNELIAESADELKTPLIMHSDQLMDSGLVVGRLEIYRSLRPLLIRTGLLALLMLPLGFGIFIILRRLPIRSLYKAEEALRSNEKEAKELAQENAVMAEIGRVISSTLNIDEIYERFAQEAKKLIEFDRICVTIINQKENTVSVPYIWGTAVSGRQDEDVFPLSGSATGEVFKIRSSLIIQVEDEKEVAARYPGFLPNLQAGLRSTMVIPLISKDEMIGALFFLSKRPNTYTDRDRMLAESIGYQIAGAIANAQLFAEHKRGEKEREKLIHELQGALANIKILRGMLPICSSCKKVRDDKGYWSQIESYIQHHTEAEFSHGICPECMKKLYPDLI